MSSVHIPQRSDPASTGSFSATSITLKLPNRPEITAKIESVVSAVRNLNTTHANRSLALDLINDVRKLGVSLQRATAYVEGAVNLYDGDDEEKRQLMDLIMSSENLKRRTSQLLMTLGQIREQTKALQRGPVSRFFGGRKSISDPPMDTALKDMAASAENALECFEGRDSAGFMEVVEEAKNVKEKQGQFRVAEHTAQFISDVVREPGSFSTLQGNKNKLLEQYTRRNISTDLYDWLLGDDRIYCLVGGASTGKTSIAYGLYANFLSERQRSAFRGASFSFPSSNQNLASLDFFLPAITYSLQPHLHSETVGEIRACLDHQGPTEARRAAEEMLRKALAQTSEPLSESGGMRIILIIDGVDKYAEYEEVPGFLQFLLNLILEFPRLYVFITTRPRPSIMHTLSDPRFSVKTRYHQLGTGAEHWAGRAKEYFETTLLNIPVHGDYFRSNPRTFQRLLQHAQSDFTFASTMAGFLSAEQDFPGAQLNDFFGTESTRFSRQNTIYRSILHFASANHQSPLELLKLLTLLHFVVVEGDTLTPEIITSYTPHLSVDDVISIAERLRSLLAISPKGEVILLHPSFREFLVDRHRCRDSRFLVNRHTHLTSVCLAPILHATPAIAALMIDPLPTITHPWQQLRHPLLSLWPQYLAQAGDSDPLRDQLQRLIPSPQLAMYAWVTDEAQAMAAGGALAQFTKQFQGSIENDMTTKCTRFFEFVSYVQVWRDRLLHGGSQTITRADIFQKILRTCTMESVPVYITLATKHHLRLCVNVGDGVFWQADIRCDTSDQLSNYHAVVKKFTAQLQSRPGFLEEAVFVELSRGTYRIDSLASIRSAGTSSPR